MGAEHRPVVTPLEFRNVHDGDQIPAHCFRGGGIHGASLFAWACPSLTDAEAEALGRRADGMAVSAKAIRDFIEFYIETVRAELADASGDNLVKLMRLRAAHDPVGDWKARSLIGQKR